MIQLQMIVMKKYIDQIFKITFMCCLKYISFKDKPKPKIKYTIKILLKKDITKL